MQITDVRLRKVNSENRMKAVASVTFDNEFAVHDIKVIESQNGLFIAMPSRKTPYGEFRDIAHPINAETREKIQKAILEAYEAPEEASETEESAEQIIQYLKENGVVAMRQGGIMDVYTSNSIAGEDIMIDENQLGLAENLLKEFEPIKVNTSNHKLMKESSNSIMNRILLGIIAIIILTAIFFIFFWWDIRINGSWFNHFHFTKPLLHVSQHNHATAVFLSLSPVT